MEGGKVVEVTVREGAPVITVMFRVAEAAGLTLEPTSSLFEIAPQLKLRELNPQEIVEPLITATLTNISSGWFLLILYVMSMFCVYRQKYLIAPFPSPSQTVHWRNMS